MRNTIKFLAKLSTLMVLSAIVSVASFVSKDGRKNSETTPGDNLSVLPGAKVANADVVSDSGVPPSDGSGDGACDGGGGGGGGGDGGGC